MDVKTCLAHINKTKRQKLARHLSHLSDQAQIVALQGITAATKPRNDGGGMIILLVRDENRSRSRSAYPVEIVLDERTTWGNFRAFPLRDPLPAQVAEMLADFAPSLFTAAAESAQDDDAGAPEKPFSGWRGGRPRRVLSDTEKAAIDKARTDGKTIDAIAKAMHISNRVVSAYCKMPK